MIGRRLRSLFFELRRSQYLAPHDIKAFQEFKLKRMVQHAYNNVPYYRKSMHSIGLRPEDIKTLADLSKLPLLSKQDVRKNLYFDLFSAKHKKSEMLRVQTSGSTGEPFVIYADKHQLEIRMATTMRAAEWTGWRFGDRQARLWHQTIGMSLLQVVREKIDAWFMRRLFIPAYELRDDNIATFIERVRQHRPILIDGYAESFNFLAQYLQKNSIPPFKPKAIMSSAQIMPDNVRSIIEEKLGAPVFDKYGSREFSGIAYEDEDHDGHLVMAESYIVEILKDGRPAQAGEIGEVIITDLNNFHLPILRYRIGDLAQAIESCTETRRRCYFPRVGRIEGRAQAIVVCNNGAWLPGTFFAHYFKDYDHLVRHYQIIQDNRDGFLLKIVPGPVYNKAGMAELISGLGPFIGNNMNILVELVAEIPLVRTGKRTSIVSNLGLDFQNIDSESGALQ